MATANWEDGYRYWPCPTGQIVRGTGHIYIDPLELRHVVDTILGQRMRPTWQTVRGTGYIQLGRRLEVLASSNWAGG